MILIIISYVLLIIISVYSCAFQMYSGFYKTKIEPVAKDAWKLMQLIGYEQVGMCLELKKVPNATKLQEVAFEFFLASVECGFLAEIFEKVSANGGFTRKEVYDCRRKTQGDTEVLLTELRTLRGGSEKPNDGDNLQFKGRGVDYSSKLPFLDSEEQFHHKAIDKMENLENIPNLPFVADKIKLSSQRTTTEILAGLHHSESHGDGCEKKTESIEAMLQAITPEMISDASIRKQILLKLQPAGETISLPPLPDPTVNRDPPVARPNTEPIHIPPGRERSKTSHVTDRSAVRGHTEPLAEPKHSPKPRGIDLKSITWWQCLDCSFVNKEVIGKRTQTCSACERPRRDT